MAAYAHLELSRCDVWMSMSIACADCKFSCFRSVENDESTTFLAGLVDEVDVHRFWYILRMQPVCQRRFVQRWLEAPDEADMSRYRCAMHANTEDENCSAACTHNHTQCATKHQHTEKLHAAQTVFVCVQQLSLYMRNNCLCICATTVFVFQCKNCFSIRKICLFMGV